MLRPYSTSIPTIRQLIKRITLPVRDPKRRRIFEAAVLKLFDAVRVLDFQDADRVGVG